MIYIAKIGKVEFDEEGVMVFSEWCFTGPDSSFSVAFEPALQGRNYLCSLGYELIQLAATGVL